MPQCSSCSRHVPFSRIPNVIARGKCVPIVPGVSLGRSFSEANAPSASALPEAGAASPAGSLGNPTVIDKSTGAPHVLLEEPPWVGRRQFDRSHSLEACKGIIMCVNCGFFAISDATSLAKPCSRKLSRTGSLTLGRWCKGQTPALKVNWPDASPGAAGRRLIWKP